MADSGISLYNPKVPQCSYIKLKLGGVTYEAQTPNFIKSFSFSKTAYRGRGSFTIVISDVMDYGMEQRILDSTLGSNGAKPIYFQYGHAEGSRSPWFAGTIRDYTPNFLTNLNANFTLTGFSDISYGNYINKTYYLSDYGKRISNIIKAICEAEGWKLAEPFVTSDIYEGKSIYISNKTAIEAIQQDLVPKAFKNKNSLGFLHYTRNDSVHVRLVEIDVTKIKISKKDFNFVINGGNYGSVLSFAPQYSGTVYASLKVQAGYVDRETNQFTLFKNDPNLGKNYPDNTQFLGATSVPEFNNLIQNQWIGNSLAKITAQMEIVGDPDIYPMDYINVIPIRPDGKLHHSAGTYYVNTVEDSIQGAYKTTLGLIRIPGMDSKISDAYESGWGQS
jgi:hypothetical protein